MSGISTARLCAGLLLAMLSPLLAHTAWRPLAVALGGPLEARALGIAVLAVVVAGASAALAPVRPRAFGWAGPVALGATLGTGFAGLPGFLTLVLVALLARILAPPMARRIAASWADPAAGPPRWALGLWALVVLAATVGLVDLATFLGDPASGRGIGRGTHLAWHFCATAYVHAAELLRAGVTDVYDLALVPGPEGEVWPESAAHMAPFALDRFGYPPQFLLVPLASTRLVPDFAAWRAAWACGNALLFAWVLWEGGFWVGRRSGRVFRVLAPPLFLLGGLVFQSGNVHLSIFGIGLLAMGAFHERRSALGGALLAAATLGKIAPGLMGVFLLVRGRWRGVATTVAWAIAATLLTLAITGPEVFWAFFETQLPAVASGEAYDFLDDTPENIVENLAPFGLPFKLQALGLDLDPWVWGPRLGSAYTVLAFAMAVLGGRRVLDRRGHAVVWMLLVTVASLRSPMAAGYMLAGVFISLGLVAAEYRTGRDWVVGGGLFLALVAATPFGPGSLWVALFGQAVMHSLIVWMLLRRWAPLDAEHGPAPFGGDPASASRAQDVAASTRAGAAAAG